MKPIRALLADDHTIVRAGIRSLLEKQPGLQVVAEAADGRQALALAATHQPDIVLLDIGMPGLNGLETTVRLRQAVPSARIIILSMHANEEYVVQALQAGASGYILKQSAIDDLGAAIKNVLAGQTYLCPTLAARLPGATAARSDLPRSPLQTLTPRQREILQLIAERKNTKEIAGLLGLSPKTVEFHRAQLMERLHIFDVPGLVRYAIQSGVTPAEV
jgi:DNA-binding NarL/FixJ family response regulator